MLQIGRQAENVTEQLSHSCAM